MTGYSISLLIIALSFFSCGKKDDKNSSGGATPLPLTAAEQISGEWNGIYRGMVDGRPSSDAYVVNANFSSDGKFQIVNPNDVSAFVRGNWNEFQGKSLLLSVSESSIPKIGLAGALIEASYDLVGSQLRFGSATFEVKLSKKAVSTPADPVSSKIFGKWRCKSGDNRVSVLELLESSEFRLSSQGRGERVFIAKGAIESSSGNSFRLITRQSSDPVPSGSVFIFEINGELGTLRFSRSDNTSVDLGTCEK
jgi:hypothetical protein